MKAKARLFGIVYSLIIAFIIAVVLGFAAPSLAGQPITVAGFASSLLQGTIVGGLVGIILPIKKMADWFCGAVGAQTKMASSVCTCILLAAVFAIIMNLYFTAINTGFATFQTEAGPVTFMTRYMTGFSTLYAYIFVGAFIGDPIAFAIARKVTGFPPKAPEADKANLAAEAAAA